MVQENDMGVSRQLDFDTAVPGFLNAGRLIGISLPEAGLRTVSEALELSGRRFIFLEKAGFSDYFAVPTTRSDDFAVNVGNLAPQRIQSAGSLAVLVKNSLSARRS